MKGIELIKEERIKQLIKYRYNSEHDAQHTNKELALGALAYLYAAIFNDDAQGFAYWPFDIESWHSEDYVENLKKAGAFIAAELDRLQIN